MKQANSLRLVIATILGLLFVVLPGLAAADDRPDVIARPDEVKAAPLFPPQSASPTPQQGPPPKGGPTFLSGPNTGAPLDIALDYIQRNKWSLGLTDADLSDVVVKDQYVSQHNQVSHIYLRQRLNGIEVFNGDININVDRDGRIINLGNHFVSNLGSSVNARTHSISAIAAVEAAARHLNLTITEPLVVRKTSGGPANEMTLSDGGISLEDIPAELMYLPHRRGEVRLVWSIVLRLKNGLNWWHIRVDAVTGDVLSKNDWIANDTYYVHPLPNESPNDGPRALAINPADPVASPFGWHDIDGLAGAEFSDTRGNNVFAQEDLDANDKGGFRPDGGVGLVFSSTLDLKLEPSDYFTASIINLFYWNNILHDIHYQYGFDETSGNFQQHNYGRGGLAGDPVQADAQDGSDRDNANFGTPPDPFDPRMQMFIWTFTTPHRDSALDSGIIAHEYGHGVSNRLTGGPHNVNCLFNSEQMGEGWSDLHTLFLTAVVTDTGSTPRGVGTYVLGEPANGPGVRSFPYSTDLGVNPLTYDDIKTARIPHGVGEVWAAIVWEVYWRLVDEYGFDPDFYQGTGGNNLTMQLVMDGLKLQPCNPSFVDGRDAILLADQVNNGGANQCHIWQGFAKRGLGVSATAGSSFSVSDGVEAFDLPLQCRTELVITKNADPSPVQVGNVLTYSLIVANYTSLTLTNGAITDSIPVHTTYVPGSASDGGNESGGIIRWDVGTLLPDMAVTRTFQVRLDTDFPEPISIFFDDMESEPDNWVVTHTLGTEDWVLDTANPYSGLKAWFASNPYTSSDKSLILATPVAVADGNILSFWHFYDTEPGYDGGVVEISTDGGVTWADLGPSMIQNDYNGTIFSGHPGFTGSSNGYLETVVDLNNYSGMEVQIRFRMLSDLIIGGNGWYVDDVKIVEQVNIDNTAFFSSDQGEMDTVTISTPVVVPAALSYLPAEIEKTMLLNQTLVTSLTLFNTGSLPLNFAIPLVKNSFSCDVFDNTNNDFERGDFNGWTVIDDYGTWLINDGSYPRLIDEETTPVLAGNFSALVDQLGPGKNVLYRDVALPADLPAAVIVSWTDQWENHASLFSSNQEFRVVLYGPGGTPLLGELFSTNQGDLLASGPTKREVDVTSLVTPYAGQSIRLQFEVRTNLFFFNVQVDEVQLCEADPIWVTTSPSGGVISPQGDKTIDVIFKSWTLTQTGDYSAELRFDGNMANTVTPLPLVIHVVPSESQFLPIILKPRPAALFFDDMERGGDKWTATGLWHLEADSDPCGNSFSPTTSWYYGQDTTCTYDTGFTNSGELTTLAPITLPASSNQPTLTFSSWENTEDVVPYDSRQVLISTDGTSFTSLWTSSNNGADWYQVELDLSDYIGQNIWVRFAFDTVDGFSNDFSGWYVDDVRVTE